jgi:sugar lactone lactonase YvrE
LAATAWVTIQANFVWDEISPNLPHTEALIYVQTCPELKPVVEEGVRLYADGEDPAAAVGGEAGWPLTWYWRRTPTWWDLPKPGMRPPLVLCNPEQEAEARRRLGPGYVAERIPLRAWWLMEERLPGPTQLLRYALRRIPWGSVGSSDVIVLRRSEGAVEWSRPAEVPAELASALGATRASIMGEGSLMEPRGISVDPDGRLAVADVGLSTVVFFLPDGTPEPLALSMPLREPESVAWTPQQLVAIADTWGQQVVLFQPAGGTSRTLPVPGEGWYGPRGVAVAADGTVAATDTGNKRLAFYTSTGGEVQVRVAGQEGDGPAEFVEPVGLAWLDEDRLLVCDTGNRRIQIVDRRGAFVGEVQLPEAWGDFYSRPQVAVLGPELWVASDTPGGALWVIEERVPRRVTLADQGIAPTGVAARGDRLWVADQGGRIWIFDLKLDSRWRP